MQKWIVRKDLRGESVGTPHCFMAGNPIARIPGAVTLEEFAALLLAPNERLQPADRLWIDRHGERVGYVEILDRTP